MRLRREVRKALRRVPERMTLEDLHGIAEKQLGMPISVEELAPGLLGSGVTGMWVMSRKKSVIFLSADHSRALRRHTLLHEYGHILLDHRICEFQASDTFKRIGRGMTAERLLRRSLEATHQEVAAEQVAGELARRVRRSSIPVGLDSFS